ncbi:MAG TPA: glycosyltransferase family 39 protein [Frankiaceae bacterium]|nr:glycosyltransferase family 39 protein [Frankiaceae bacterium]
MTDVALAPPKGADEPPPSAPQVHSRRDQLAWGAFWAGIAACVVYCILVRLWGPRGLWLDESQSVAIARLPLTGHGTTLIQGLKQDGSPPVYYLLLHWWIELFGNGDRTVRALSFVLNLLCIPPLYWLGKRVIGKRAAWVAVLAFITSPFAAYYASETRMYSLLVLLALLGALALERTLRVPTWWSVLGISVASVAVAMTHYWSLYSLVTVAVFLLVGAFRGSPVHRRGCKLSIVGLLGGAVLFIPWFPTFLYQSKHTGTPWGAPASYAAVVHAFGQWAGGQLTAGRALLVVVCALLAMAVFGYPAGPRQVLIDLKGHEPGRLLLLLSLSTLLLAVTVGKLVGNAWADRYTAVAFIPFILCLALGPERLSDRRLWAGSIGLMALFGTLAAGPVVTAQRTQAVQVARILSQQAKPGDVVLYCPDQLGPAIAREINAGRGGSGLKNYSIPTFAPPDRVDWVDYKARNAAADHQVPQLVQRALAAAGGHRIWLVYSGEYLTYQNLCPDLRLALAQQRSIFIWAAASLDSYEHEELDSFTARRP